MQTILGRKGSIPAIAEARFQRWAVALFAYTNSLKFKPTIEDAEADCFSRLLKHEDDSGEPDETFHFLRLPSTLEQVQQHKTSSLQGHVAHEHRVAELYTGCRVEAFLRQVDTADHAAGMSALRYAGDRTAQAKVLGSLKTPRRIYSLGKDKKAGPELCGVAYYRH